VAHAHPISRAGLRHLLLRGLDNTVTWDKRVVGYEQPAAGGVVAHFADGSSARGDVLVGADGSSSAVRKQLLPHARVVDTGVAGIGGKLYLNEGTRALLPPELLSQMTLVLPPVRWGVFMAPFRRRPDAQADDALDLPEHLFWVLLSRADALGLDRAPRQRSGAELQQRVLRLLERSHPLLRRIVTESDVDGLIGVPLHTSQAVPAWRSTNVTLLGDAIHTMTPLLGLGGNTALRDAAVLSYHLIEADRGRTDLLAAIGAYEAAMRNYGFDAVQRSLQMSSAVTSSNVFSRMTFRGVLRIADHLQWLQHRLFDRPLVQLPTHTTTHTSTSAPTAPQPTSSSSSTRSERLS
jgi:2-polyprenyl-6-methoxyphenol hydroxylase-like FAD-dependent oxidoreductase